MSKTPDPRWFPRVTVLVNTYNQERFIAEALESILAQDWPEEKLDAIVVDDGSTDSTFSIVQKFGPRIRCLRKPNGGQVSAFHAGLAEVRGDVVAFLDGDDWWHPTKIRRVVDAFNRYPGIAAVGHGYYEVDQNGSILSTMLPALEYHLTLSSPEAARFAADLRVFGGTSRMAIRRLALERVVPVPEELPFFDNFIFTQALGLAGAVILPELLTYYRLHSANLYASEANDETRLRRKYQLQRSLTEYLPPRLRSLGISEDVIHATLESDFTDRDRLNLMLNGGSPRDTFRVERLIFKNSYTKSSIGYIVFKYATLLITLVLPPQTFYKLRRWYTRKNLRELRHWIGSGVDAVPSGVVKQPQNPNAKT
jgi:glycosyltransferase involved in cell wall biosynthesis